MRRIRLRYYVFTVVSIAVGAALYVGYSVSESIRNSYAVWWVADMVVEHMKANQNEWPKSWSDLEDDYQTCVARSRQPWSFDELSQHVTVDWNVDPLKLAALNDSEIRAIWLADGTDSHWEHAEPNEIIVGYLRSQNN